MTDHPEQIRALVLRINELWRERRYDEIGELVHDDVVVAPPGTDQRIHGRDAYVQSYRDYDQAAKTLEFTPSDPQIDIVGDAAVAICPFSVVYELQGATHRETGRDLLVLSRSGGAWRIAWRTMQADAPPA